jgi:hypothetical protein
MPLLGITISSKLASGARSARSQHEIAKATMAVLMVACGVR